MADGASASAASGGEFQVEGANAAALFTLKIHRGDGMCLLAMNWKGASPPPDDFVGFAIEYQPPGGTRLKPLVNRLAFPQVGGAVNKTTLSTRLSPIQKFRWAHFPSEADQDGLFTYQVTPVFMDGAGQLSYGAAQTAQLALSRETWPGEIDVGFTRGFVSSQAFVDRFEKDGDISTLLPAKADDGLTFVPTHPDAQAAYDWMGFDARWLVRQLLQQAVDDPTAKVCAVAYDLNLPEVVDQLVALGPRLRMIVDDSGSHKPATSAESAAFERIVASAGAGQVVRQHMGGLQHNKFIVVGGAVNRAICGSTNFSWRAFFVQNNNAMTISGPTATKLFEDAFDAYWASKGKVTDFDAGPSADWQDLGLSSVKAQISFSPHSAGNAKLDEIAEDIAQNTKSSLLYSLAFLYQTPGKLQDAIKAVSLMPDRFVYGISDHAVGSLAAALAGNAALGVEVQKPDGNVAPVSPAALTDHVPAPFKPEPTGGSGVRMHHKFVVIDFNTPDARVYMGSYNFSSAADLHNGENLLVIRDARVATSYAVEAITMFDHYQFRTLQAGDGGTTTLTLDRPPAAGGKPWFWDDWNLQHKVNDRLLFA